MFENFKRKIQPLINVYHGVRADFARLAHWFPSRKIKVIGVTGTDGKTTTTHLIYHILKDGGKKVSMISSVYAKIGDQIYETGLHTTTPDAVLVQKLVKKAVRAGDEYLVLETTSHALDQNRVRGIQFEISLVTNITPEHMDYHKTYDNYVKAKAKLLLSSKISIINADDQSFKKLKKILNKDKKKYFTYGLREHANFSYNFKKDIKGISKFNNYNYLAAFGVCKLLGLLPSSIMKSMKSYQLPQGRLELVHKDKFTVIIDFAHTPNSLENVLSYIKNDVVPKGGRLIHVFGAAGLRDAIKRPFMGEASGKYADVTILTEEDYRTEDPEQISKEIALGLVKQGMLYVKTFKQAPRERKIYTINLERNKAIDQAVKIAKKNDVIILTGKSHEKSLARGKEEFAWDEKGAVMTALNALKR